MPTIPRILDANANRAREALRVMEEAARFHLDDRSLARELKQLRHDLAGPIQKLPDLTLHRDTPGDVGTSLTTSAELSRISLAQVVLAAGKRLSEALRCLEEYSKLLPGKAAHLSASFKSLRYRGYTLEQTLNLQLAVHDQPANWRLCVLLTDALCPDGDALRIAQAAIDAAVKLKSPQALCLQLREKSMDAGPLLDRARKLVKLGKSHGVSIIINDRPDIALLAGADGVHLGQTDLPCPMARKLVGADLLIGVSTSMVNQAEKAIRNGVDYCGIGPMFSTTTKHKDIIVGPRYLQQFVRQFPQTPYLAIGGITLDRLPMLQKHGVRAVAVSSAVCQAADPGRVVTQFLTQLKKTSRKNRT